MAEKALRKLVIIDEAQLTGMAQNDLFVKEFTFLGKVRTYLRSRGKGKGCGRCGGAAKERNALYGQAKAALAGMPADSKRRLKELLHAHRVRIYFSRAGDGKTVEFTF